MNFMDTVFLGNGITSYKYSAEHIINHMEFSAQEAEEDRSSGG